MNTVNKDELSKELVTGCFKINSVINTQHNSPILGYGKPIRFVFNEKRILSISCDRILLFEF